MRAAAIAASQPACPAPTTTTSYFSEKLIIVVCLCACLKRLLLFYQALTREASTALIQLSIASPPRRSSELHLNSLPGSKALLL